MYGERFAWRNAVTRLLRSRGGGGGIRLLIAVAVAEVGAGFEEKGGEAPAPGAFGGDIVGVLVRDDGDYLLGIIVRVVEDGVGL